VPRVRGLDRVDDESADRVDAELVERVLEGLDARALVDPDRHDLPPRGGNRPACGACRLEDVHPFPIAPGDLTDRCLSRDPAVCPISAEPTHIGPKVKMKPIKSSQNCQ